MTIPIRQAVSIAVAFVVLAAGGAAASDAGAEADWRVIQSEIKHAEKKAKEEMARRRAARKQEGFECRLSSLEPIGSIAVAAEDIVPSQEGLSAVIVLPAGTNQAAVTRYAAGWYDPALAAEVGVSTSTRHVTQRYERLANSGELVITFILDEHAELQELVTRVPSMFTPGLLVELRMTCGRKR